MTTTTMIGSTIIDGGRKCVCTTKKRLREVVILVSFHLKSATTSKMFVGSPEKRDGCTTLIYITIINTINISNNNNTTEIVTTVVVIIILVYDDGHQ